jgi:2-methylcitrate dehydratase PrpD
VIDAAYRVAFLDWLACAAGGWNEPAARAARDALPRAVAIWLGTAGHVLDYDDTYGPGLCHCSAAAAPAALAVGADADASVGEVLAAYTAGFEATAAVARASHPALYERGWHPTSVCGVIGAAVAASALLGLGDPAPAVSLALVQAAGLLGAFGTDGKALQVGMAAAAGVRAARLASAGASAPADLASGGFAEAYGATWADPDPNAPAIRENWIKAYPCCLQTHAAIEAAVAAREEGVSMEGGRVVVHPISMQAAPYGIPSEALQAKFSIAYTTAFTLLDGPPDVADFRGLDDKACRLAEEVHVETDPSLGQSEARLEAGGQTFTVAAALGSPQRPMNEEQLGAKVRSLAGDRFDGLLEDDVRAREVLARLTAIS